MLPLFFNKILDGKSVPENGIIPFIYTLVKTFRFRRKERKPFYNLRTAEENICYK